MTDEYHQNESFRRGYDTAFAMGIATISEYWSFMLPYLGTLKRAIEDLDDAHMVVFDTIEGRAAGAPTFKHAPSDIWDRMTGNWPGILKHSTAEAAAPPSPPVPDVAATAEPRESRGTNSPEVAVEIILFTEDDRHGVAIRQNGVIVARSPAYRDRAVAEMMVRELVKRARQGIEDRA